MRNKLEALQGLRALAASLVVYVHAMLNLRDKAGAVITDNLSMAGLGVRIFFVISGFIIFTSSNGQSVGEFLRRRLLRVVPIYWLVTAVYAAKLAKSGAMPSVGKLAKSLCFIPYLNAEGAMRPVLGVGWTLNYEMFFYAVFGLCLIFRRRLQLIVPVVVLGGLVIARSLGLIPSTAMLLYTWADPIIGYFILGMIVGYWREQAHLPSLSMAKASLLSYGLVMAFILLHVPSLLTPLICIACLLICVMPQKEDGMPWLKLAGDASYSTYLIHGFVLGPVARLMWGYRANPIVFSLVMVIVCNIVGIVVYRLIEKPLIKLVSNLQYPTFNKFSVSMLLLTLVSSVAMANWEPDYERLANAIYKAEGGPNTNHPYGIMPRYKHTTPRQACLNTLKSKYASYLQLEGQGEATESGYLRYLAGKYAPLGASNDPQGLNKNWLDNVRYFYAKEALNVL